MCQTIRALWVLWRYVLTATLAGCSATSAVTKPSESAELRQVYAIHEPTLTCEQANQISYRTVERLAYTVVAFTPAAPGGSGSLKGTREGVSGPEPVSVQIACLADGVHIDANAESPLDVASERALPLSSTHDASQLAASGALPPRVYFRRAFYALFTGMARAAARGEPPQPQGQMQVRIKPLIGLETKLEFGTEVIDVLPVRVEVVNTTERAYILEADKIVLLTPDGQRVKSLSTSDRAFPAPPLASQRLAPGASLKGYLYYPHGSYTAARGFLTEEEGQEREGFDVQF